MTWFWCSVSILLVLTCSALPSYQALPYCPWPKCWTQTEGIQVHPCELCTCTSTASSALEKGSRKDVTKAWTGLLSSCFHKRQNLCFISFLQFNRLVKISMETSPYFEMTCPNEAYHIIPPSTSCPVRIRFTPNKNQVRLEEPKQNSLQSQCFPCTLGMAHPML